MQNKAVIQGADDLFAWTQCNSNQSVVKYFYVSKEEVNEAKDSLAVRCKGLQRVIGIMKVRAVYPLSEREILTRELSCCCEECMIHPSPVCNWKKHTLVLTPAALPVMP